ncbi:hypothetical protein EWB00_006872 [Schistosoma japonicum]|uniref:Uncharacterized protein n=1 Tax=Schistosoma japonicum TaxID=6182 RepID=A0A4Z2CWG8_SCHJA|nr:hypothetical protein EWB00_006872 [Schistosoma japonicum]
MMMMNLLMVPMKLIDAIRLLGEFQQSLDFPYVDDGFGLKDSMYAQKQQLEVILLEQVHFHQKPQHSYLNPNVNQNHQLR